MDKHKKQKNPLREAKQGQEQIENLKLQLARALADYENLRKRVEREREESKYLSKLVVVSRLLPVFDMFTDAQNHLQDPGLGIALQVLRDTLKEEGIEEIKTQAGDEFDHELHEAVDTVPGEEENEGKVAEVTMKGYKFSAGPVIRHTKVKVFKGE